MSTSTVSISAGQVKDLREKTGAPMMDCKQALTEAKGDMEQAVVILRKKGVSVAVKSGKPAHIAEKMVAGKMEKFYEEVCLMEQPFIKDQTISIGQLVAAKIGKLGENIAVRRFARFKVGDAGETIAITKPTEAKAE